MSDSLRPYGLLQARILGVCSLSLLQGIFPTQGLNPGLPPCRWILYQLSHKGSPVTYIWNKWTYLRNGSRLTDTENRHGYQKWKVVVVGDILGRYKLLYIKYINNKVLLYSTGNCTQYPIRSDQISRSVMSDSLWPHESQDAGPPCLSPTPGVHWDSRPSSQWCRPSISSSVIPFSCPQSLPASESFPMSQLFAWGDHTW